MTTLLLNTLLALAWIALTGTFTPTNAGIGFLVGFILLGITQRVLPESNYFRKVPQVIAFVLFFAWKLIQANLRMVWIVLSPRMSIRPAVVAIPLDVRTYTEVTVLANLITLTPGTLYIDVSEDLCVMYVHTIFVDDLESFRRTIKDGFERRVMEVFR